MHEASLLHQDSARDGVRERLPQRLYAYFTRYYDSRMHPERLFQQGDCRDSDGEKGCKRYQMEHEAIKNGDACSGDCSKSCG